MAFNKLKCRVFGHRMPGEAGEFMAPIRPGKPSTNLPYLTLPCARCGAALRLPFVPGTRGGDKLEIAAAIQRWRESQDGEGAPSPSVDR